MESKVKALDEPKFPKQLQGLADYNGFWGGFNLVTLKPFRGCSNSRSLVILKKVND
jgi:hypothetical protein